jgi:hypothetical protein
MRMRRVADLDAGTARGRCPLTVVGYARECDSRVFRENACSDDGTAK